MNKPRTSGFIRKSLVYSLWGIGIATGASLLNLLSMPAASAMVLGSMAGTVVAVAEEAILKTFKKNKTA